MILIVSAATVMTIEIEVMLIELVIVITIVSDGNDDSSDQPEQW